MQEPNTDRILWRIQERYFVSTLALSFLIARLWYVATHQIELGSPFEETHTSFNLYKNVLIPDIGRGLALYLAYILLTLYTIPRLIRGNRAARISLILQTLVVVILLGVILNTAEYYNRQWQFNYPGFSIFFNKENPRSQINLAANFFIAAMLTIIYGAYAAIREMIIYMIGRSRRPAFNTSVCNKLTAFTFITIGIYIFLTSFDLTHERHFLVIALIVLCGLFVSFVTNVYWLFPMKGDSSFFSARMLIPLLGTSFIFAIPLTTLTHENGFFFMLSCWIFQLLIITPLTWVYYQFNRETIQRLRMAETQLQQSQADLQFLRSQVNPHFLFNTLNTLYGTALRENAERTAEGIQMLGDMMRFMLHENNQDFIDMQKEIGYLENYIDLQKQRVREGENMSITHNFNVHSCHHRIAPMLLIPLVENAFKHGISLIERSWIDIRLTCNDMIILLEVSNSVHANNTMDPERDKSGIGLTNVRERLKIIYPGKHSLNVTANKEQFSISLTITP